MAAWLERRGSLPQTTSADQQVPMWSLRPVQAREYARVREVVKTVLEEFGFQHEPDGTDEDLEDMDEHYTKRGGTFLVLIDDTGAVVGCGGLYPVDQKAAELRKMYFLPEARGRGWGRRMLLTLVAYARSRSFATISLETSSRLSAAAALYRSVGFLPVHREHLAARCDMAMELHL